MYLYTYVCIDTDMCVYLSICVLGHDPRQGIMREEEEILREAGNRIKALM